MENEVASCFLHNPTLSWPLLSPHHRDHGSHRCEPAPVNIVKRDQALLPRCLSYTGYALHCGSRRTAMSPCCGPSECNPHPSWSRQQPRCYLQTEDPSKRTCYLREVAISTPKLLALGLRENPWCITDNAKQSERKYMNILYLYGLRLRIAEVWFRSNM